MAGNNDTDLICTVIDQLFKKADQAILANDVRSCENHLRQIIPLIERLPMHEGLNEIKSHILLISRLMLDMPTQH